MSLSIDFDPIQEIQMPDGSWLWHIVYTANYWRHTHELMIPDPVLVLIAKEAGLHMVNISDDLILELNDDEVMTEIIMYDDYDFLPIIQKLHEMRKSGKWNNILKTI